MFRILIDSPNREQRQVRCLHNTCGIGRDDANLVVLQGWSIGQQHASIRRLANGLGIEPLGGRAPVSVNGRKISTLHAPLADSDRIEIGDYRLQVIDEAPPAPVAAAATPPAPAPAGPPAPVPAAEPETPPTGQQLARPGEAPADMAVYRARVHAAL